MIENLYEIGLNKDFVEELISIHGYDLILNLSCNHELINKNISIFKACNINTNDLLTYKPEIFLLDTEYIYNKLLSVNLTTFITLLNEDITVIDDLI